MKVCGHTLPSDFELYEHYLQPACKALGLGHTRLHDLRHSFATRNLSAGERYRLGRSSFALTLTTYADYINETELAAPKVGRWHRKPDT